MRDEGLRELERAAAQGDADAQERLIRARLRLGDVDTERVALAAYAGDAAAARILPTAAPADLNQWLSGLRHWGRVVQVRAALAVARRNVQSRPLQDLRLVLLHPHVASVTLDPARPLVIGRGPQATLRLKDPHVSRLHCRIDIGKGGVVRVLDLESYHGTFVDGIPVDDTVLGEGQVLRVGGRHLFELRGPASAESHRRRELQAIQAWLEAPGDETARAAARLAAGLKGQSPFANAIRAAVNGICSHPPTLGKHFLYDHADRTRSILEAHLTTWALTPGADLPAAPHPPLEIAVLPEAERRRPDRWREFAGFLEPLGLRPIEFPISHYGAPPYGEDQEGFALLHAERADGGQEGVAVLAGPNRVDPRWLRVRHPHVAPVLSIETRADATVLREERAGEPLVQWAARVRPGARQAVAMTLALADALHACSPILVSGTLDSLFLRVLPDGKPVWSWLAIARDLQEAIHNEDPAIANLPPSESELLRVAWAAPEYIEDCRAPETQSSAVYSLGVALYYLLTGRPPFIPKSSKVLLAILDRPPPDPREWQPRVPQSVVDVLMKALAKAPQDRHDNPGAFGQALRAACKDGA